MKALTPNHLIAAACIALAGAGCQPTQTTTDEAPTVSPEKHGEVRGETSASDFGGEDSAGDTAKEDAPVVNTKPVLKVCGAAPAPSWREEDWEHRRNKAVTLAKAEHSAQDVLVTTSSVAIIEGKFAYGRASKDLEDERVEIFMDDCSGAFRSLGVAKTDSDGRVAFRIPPEAMPAPGEYALYQQVKGDGSFARSVLRIYPEGTRLVVFDIDGTLTTKDAEIFEDAIADFFEPIYREEVSPEAREGAKETTLLRHAQNYPLVYLTGRPYVLTRITREWLQKGGYAPGTLHVTNSNSEVVPDNGGVGKFKRAYLEQLVAQGFTLAHAYGNATTDIYAYLGAGVTPEATFIAGEHGGEEGTQAIGDDYTTHLPVARAQADAEQPFTR